MKVNKTIVTITVMMMIDNGLRIPRRWKEYKKGQSPSGCPFDVNIYVNYTYW